MGVGQYPFQPTFYDGSGAFDVLRHLRFAVQRSEGYFQFYQELEGSFYGAGSADHLSFRVAGKQQNNCKAQKLVYAPRHFQETGTQNYEEKYLFIQI